jgi:hypothetical protein
MTSLLLDHPWKLNEVLNPRSPGFRTIEHFIALTRRTRLEIAAFVSKQEYDDAWLEMDWQRYAPTARATLERFARHLIRSSTSDTLATPIQDPGHLSENWRKALRSELGDIDNWRTPQIVVSQSRRHDWPNDDQVEIQLEDQPSHPLVTRLLVSLEGYNQHPYAVTDQDPWDVRHAVPTPPVLGHLSAHPCYLPRPPSLADVPLEEVYRHLPDVRRVGWELGDQSFYIPTYDWRPEPISKGEWRLGRAFPRSGAERPGRPRYLDYRGIAWEWDPDGRHWDVQVNPYRRVSHTGHSI